MTEEEFKAEVLPLRQAMFESIVRILRDRDDSLDCLQESLAVLWDHRERFKDISNVRAYCLTTVRNGALRMLRSRQEISSEESIAETASLPATGVEERESLEILRKGLSKLPEMQRKIVLMSSVNGLTNYEIAKITGLSLTNVSTLLSRGRKALKKYFDTRL